MHYIWSLRDLKTQIANCSKWLKGKVKGAVEIITQGSDLVWGFMRASLGKTHLGLHTSES